MALIVETGSIVAGAESYISVADADTHHSNRGAAAWAALTTAQKEQALRKATDYMLQIYRMLWKGVRMSATQALDWPRAWVYLEPVVTGANSDFPNLVADNVVPTEVKNACAELALRASSATLYADLTQQKKKVKVGPIETEYDTSTSQAVRYESARAMLSPYLLKQQGTLSVVRS